MIIGRRLVEKRRETSRIRRGQKRKTRGEYDCENAIIKPINI